MWTGSAVIVFREVLEAALIIVMVLGASRGIQRRGLWVFSGAVLGAFGASLIGLLVSHFTQLIQGSGQAIFDACILFAAVLMLSWHNIWMAQHGKELKNKVGKLTTDIKTHGKSMRLLMFVVLLAVLREGTEIFIFLYALALGGTSMTGLIGGSVVGLMGASAIGCMLYFGLIMIPLRWFFTITTYLITLLAAGMASNGAAFLVQGGVLPSLGFNIWDTSALLTQNSLAGHILNILVGYSDRPMGIQIVFYAATLLTLLTVINVAKRRSSRMTKPVAVATNA